MLGFAAVAFAAALIALGLRPPKVVVLLERGMHSSTQLPILLSLLFLASFDLLSQKVGLEPVLGALAAGMVAGLAAQGDAGKLFRQKSEALSFGFSRALLLRGKRHEPRSCFAAAEHEVDASGSAFPVSASGRAWRTGIAVPQRDAQI